MPFYPQFFRSLNTFTQNQTFPEITVNNVKVRPFYRAENGRMKFGWEFEINGVWVEESSRTPQQ